MASRDANHLTPGTAKVDIYPSTLPDKTRLFLVDTPGFDDTYKSDTQILKEIADWLSVAHENKIKLTGIVYLHRILDVRLGGAAMRNLRMFKALCGDGSLGSVVLATTRWVNVTPDEGLEREQQLCTNPKMWKRMIDHGSKVMRQDRDEVSAFAILQYLIRRRRPVVLEIQKELVDNNKTLDETSAGQELHVELEKQKRDYERQIIALRKEMEEAIAKMNRDMQEELEAEKERLERKLEEARENDRQLQANREEIRRQMAEEARKERNELMEQLRQQEKLLAREEQRLERLRDQNKYELQRQKLEMEMRHKDQQLAILRRRADWTRCIVM